MKSVRKSWKKERKKEEKREMAWKRGSRNLEEKAMEAETVENWWYQIIWRRQGNEEARLGNGDSVAAG